MNDTAIVDPVDSELSDDDLDVVVGGLEHPWAGTWEVAELGPAPTAAVDDTARDATA